jgi:hypothetical protein
MIWHLLLLAALAAVLVAMWRGGYRGEVTRVVLVAILLLLGSKAIGASGGLLMVLLGAGTVAAYAALIIKRKVSEPDEAERPQADAQGYLAQPEQVEDDQPVHDARFDSGGLADYVRQQNRKAG